MRARRPHPNLENLKDAGFQTCTLYAPSTSAILAQSGGQLSDLRQNRCSRSEPEGRHLFEPLASARGYCGLKICRAGLNRRRRIVTWIS
jgi:hypothetical protein